MVTELCDLPQIILNLEFDSVRVFGGDYGELLVYKYKS